MNFKNTLAFALIVALLEFNTLCVFSLERNKMTREQVCKDNFETLFKSQWNPNVGNDPEMMSILQKYIFGEVFTIGELDNKTREMLTVTTLVVQQTMPQLKAHINALLNTGATPNEVREVIYQCAPFIGFPKTLNAIEVMNEVFAQRNIQLPLKNSAVTNEKNRYEKGLEIQKPLYGDEIKDSLMGLPDNVGDRVARLLSEVCFGDFYTREGLDFKTRELLVLAILITDGTENTLKSHIKGNLKAGNTKEDIVSAIIQCMPYVGFSKTFKALYVFKDVVGEPNMQQPFSQGEINPYGKYFTGTTHLNMLVQRDDMWNSSIGNVTFEKGARTNWHKHSGGQILLVTAGEGRYQEKGKEIQILKAGDVVKIPKDVIHWHGAAPYSQFAHISIETNIPDNNTTWLEPVSDVEYK